MGVSFFDVSVFSQKVFLEMEATAVLCCFRQHDLWKLHSGLSTPCDPCSFTERITEQLHRSSQSWKLLHTAEFIFDGGLLPFYDLHHLALYCQRINVILYEGFEFGGFGDKVYYTVDILFCHNGIFLDKALKKHHDYRWVGKHPVYIWIIHLKCSSAAWTKPVLFIRWWQ